MCNGVVAIKRVSVCVCVQLHSVVTTCLRGRMVDWFWKVQSVMYITPLGNSCMNNLQLSNLITFCLNNLCHGFS